MVSYSGTVVDPVGLHARPLSLIVTAANQFESEVMIESKGRVGNLKSIMNTLSLAIKCGDEFTVKATGADEKACIAALEETLKKNKIV